ncbi:hypothetical protein [Heyndrickxia vini]|uniref:Uncharacterized protein n=1 Tax=Heyndrickxia vini TaxID=1476025 RepID=A0ABX7E0X0_9BACI|nr:hypothetical protein [Heyndrickxia vini]QQZ08834.1 hypothetical protein I5776_17690 [Heyndrickxia vini]
MPQQKLTIVPVTLHTESKKDLPPTSPKESLTSICTIKMANVEISLHSGVDEYVIRTIMRELKRKPPFKPRISNIWHHLV